MNWNRPVARVPGCCASGLPWLSHSITESASSTNSGGKYCSTRGRHSSTSRTPYVTPGGYGLVVVVVVGAAVVGAAVVGAVVVVGAAVVGAAVGGGGAAVVVGAGAFAVVVVGGATVAGGALVVVVVAVTAGAAAGSSWESAGVAGSGSGPRSTPRSAPATLALTSGMSIGGAARTPVAENAAKPTSASKLTIKKPANALGRCSLKELRLPHPTPIASHCDRAEVPQRAGDRCREARKRPRPVASRLLPEDAGNRFVETSGSVLV